MTISTRSSGIRSHIREVKLNPFRDQHFNPRCPKRASLIEISSLQKGPASRLPIAQSRQRPPTSTTCLFIYLASPPTFPTLLFELYTNAFGGVPSKLQTSRRLYILLPRFCQTTNLHSEEQWVQHQLYQADNSSSWNQHRFLDYEHGLHDISQWSHSNGLYDWWTPESDSFEADASTREVEDGQYVQSVHTSPELELINATSSVEGFDSLFVGTDLATTAPQQPASGLQWQSDMTSNTAHSDFFGLDLGIGYGPSFAVSDEVFSKAQENFDIWAGVTSKSGSPIDSLKLPMLPAMEQPSIPSTRDSPVTSQPSKEGSKSPSTYASSSKIQKKTFHFVANSDKKTATRLRNTMTSRNLRQSKVSRIAELEKALEKQAEETERWRQRAMQAGWKEDH